MPKAKVPLISSPTDDASLAQAVHMPVLRHAVLTRTLGARLFDHKEQPSLAASALQLNEQAKRIANGDLRELSQMLYAQAMTLDTVFTELLRRSCENLGDYPIAADRYMHTALKAQSASRSTAEALTRLHQQQTVKHVHVNDGGQAVIADEFHHHAGNANANQPHASGSLDAPSASLRSEDEIREPVPIPSR
jgi:hypothetical protein